MAAQFEELSILYEDDELIAIDKPAGVFVHRTKMAERGARYVLQELRDQLGKMVNPIHRLDRPTSGVLLFAFSRETTRKLSEALASGAVEKEYLAIARGYMDDEGVIDYPLKRKDRPKDSEPQEAMTHYRCLARTELVIPLGRYQTARYCLVRLKPKTGRRHQLRRHLAHVFHPIIGDTTHGDGKHNRFFRQEFAVNRLLLFARSLSFIHPVSGERVKIEAQLPEDFCRLYEKFAW